MPEKYYWNIQSVENSSDHLSWANCADNLTNGTETVEGKTVGCSTKQCSGTKQYCVLYYYILPVKKESSFKNIPDETVKIFIKYWPPQYLSIYYSVWLDKICTEVILLYTEAQ